MWRDLVCYLLKIFSESCFEWYFDIWSCFSTQSNIIFVFVELHSVSLNIKFNYRMTKKRPIQYIKWKLLHIVQSHYQCKLRFQIRMHANFFLTMPAVLIFIHETDILSKADKSRGKVLPKKIEFRSCISLQQH